MQQTQPKPITPRQLQVLRQIAKFQEAQCYSATIGELAAELGVSRSTAFEHIAGLKEKGLVITSRGRARSLRLTAQASQLLERDAILSNRNQIPLALMLLILLWSCS